MIISGGAQSSWRTLADTLVNTGDNQRVRLVEIRGLAADTVREALRHMAAIASGSSAKRFYYHATINPRADESLTEEQWEQAAAALEKALGLEGQPRFIVEHEKGGRTYRHVVWSRIDVDTMTAIPDKWDYLVHQRTADALEREFGHKHTPRGRDLDTQSDPSPPRKRRPNRTSRHRTTARWSDADYARLVAEADRAGLTVGAHIRSCVLAAPTTRASRRPSVDVVALATLLGAVNRAGTNLHQLARQAHFGGEELNAAVEAHRQAVDLIIAAMGRNP